MKNSVDIEEYCKIIFNRSGLGNKYIKGKGKLSYAKCLMQATGLEMKRTGYEKSIVTISPTELIPIVPMSLP